MMTTSPKQIESQVVEKLFKKPKPKFKVGDRISILKTRTQNLSQWIGKTALITGINGETISVAVGEGREKKHLTLKKGWYEVASLKLPENECTQQLQVNKTISEKYYKGYRIEFFVLEDGETIKFKIFNEQWKIYNYYHEYESLEEAELGAIEWLDKNRPGERRSPPSEDTIERMGRIGIPNNTHTRQFKVGEVTQKASKPVVSPDAPIAVILFAGGGGVEAGMVEAGIRPLVAVEFDPKKPKLSSAIADCHEHNFGEYGCQVERKPVQEISRSKFPIFPRTTDFLHASPMCSNFSNAKAGEAIETPEDIAMASAVADAIRYLKPKFFTLENVKSYRNSQSFKIIASCLEVEGYIWQGQIMILLNCQARERFIVRATKGWLPPPPPVIQPVGWYEVVADLILKMADSELVAGQKESLEKFLASNEPTPLLIERTGARGEYRIKPAHLPCNTLLRSVFTDGKGSSRSKFADIWLPDGTIKSVSIEAAARLQGFPDWYEFPSDVATAGSIIGYSVPPKFAAQLFKSLQQPPPIEIQLQSCLERINQHNWHIQNLKTERKQTKSIKEAIKSDKSAIAAELERINQLLEELIIYRQFRDLVGENEARKMTLRQLHKQETPMR